jgi:hypothetical protein
MYRNITNERNAETIAIRFKRQRSETIMYTDMWISERKYIGILTHCERKLVKIQSVCLREKS